MDEVSDEKHHNNSGSDIQIISHVLIEEQEISTLSKTIQYAEYTTITGQIEQLNKYVN